MKFSYTAENTSGEVYRGVADVSDRFELYKMIRREGGKVISVSEEGKGNMLSLRYWNARFSTVPEHEKIVFARNLGAMITAGLSLARALSVLERQIKNVRLSHALSEVGGDVRRGQPLNEALSRFPRVFSRLFVAMVKSGEESGDLSNALKGISIQMEQAYTLKKKIRGALIYPAINVIAIIGIGALMLTQVVPTLAQTFEELGSELPASTQTVINVSDFLINHTFMALILFVVAISGFTFGIRTAPGRRVLEWTLLHMPLIGGIVKEVNAARTARTLSSLLSSGVDVVTSLAITREVVQNGYFRKVLKEASDDVQRGELLSKAFARNENLYPALVGEMVAVGEETGALSDMMSRLAIFYEDEVTRKTKDMSTVIEPFLMVIIGAAVGFFAISMIAPIYSLSESI